MKGFLDTSRFKVCSFLEDNYNIILDEYKKFKFNIIEDNTSDENWMMWKMAHEHSLEITKNFRKDLDWDEIFGKRGVRWFHTGGVFAALSEAAPEVINEALIF